jgi:2-polyprenyl-6-methoxyphenol hydroxylase-like FAD-dependent oxidoreductase
MSEIVVFPRADTPRAAPGGRECRIAVIGAGFSGALVAIHLWWRCRPGERVYLVERSGAVGQGLACATPNPRHLLNVRIENMSAFADEPDHFVRWLDKLPAARHVLGDHLGGRHPLAGRAGRHSRPGCGASIGCDRGLMAAVQKKIGL